MRRSISFVISLGRVVCASLPAIIRRYSAFIRHRRLVNFCSATGYESDCASRTKVRGGTHTADGNSQEALHVLTVEQPVRTHVRLSADTDRAAFAFPASEHEWTPLATPRPLARLSWARGLHQGRHGGTADQVRVTP